MVKKIKSISKMHLFIIGALLALVVGFGGYTYVKANGLLSPGELSAYHPNNTTLGGVMSHADLEKDCLHCHSPIHCVEDTKCQDCHMDVAESRSDPNSLHGRLPGVSNCEDCHPEHEGKDSYLTLLAFEHVDHYILAGFSMEKHQENYDGTPMTCTSCHLQEGMRLETLDCVTCHAEEDHEYIASHIEEYGPLCQDCHDGKDRMVEGNWNHDAEFCELEDGHADLTCKECHADQKYVGTSSDCSSCHEEPEMHAGIFGTDCTYCHTTVAWAPAELQKHDFVMAHGEDVVSECETCHGGTYTTYPCDTCHADADMHTAHADVVTDNLHDCIACHPTGRGSESVEDEGTGEATGSIEENGTTETVSEVQSAEIVILTGDHAEKAASASTSLRAAPKKDLARRSGREG